ncbi:hypothetical protein FEM48_Zijuj12G0042300 [Ziziphus jujuba var. spinosa]|uniref:Uncharacterized protein n=1 Tax=Ziziphus jujuba var. spinosa TaxID=714518 RepID=A0A978UB43_ZIZJJ|nr:hypothetical protein FEM48_Zijuj12G0042300 [Ziziphus jujuba var. spinosa]
MIPINPQDDISTAVYLAIKLASKGFTITFINTKGTHHQIIKSQPQEDGNDDQNIFAGARKSGLDIRYKTVTDAQMDELVGNIAGADPSVSCLIADTVHSWPSTIAKKYKLVYISFRTEPALVFTLYCHLDLLKAFEDVKKAEFILCNTVEEHEPHAISAIREKQPIYAIGPVLDNEQDRDIVAASLSYVLINKLDIEEIAQELLLSKVSFIWVLRPGTVSYAESYVLPVGFEDEIKGRGLTVPWCNQIEVISHPELGVLNTLWMELSAYGVVYQMLCFPILSDQVTNRKLVVDDWNF